MQAGDQQSANGVTFRMSRRRLVHLTMVGFLLAVLSACIAFIVVTPEGGLVEAVFWFAIPCLALFLDLARRNLRNRLDIVRITHDGIMDFRIAPETIPWHAIQGIAIREVNGLRLIILDVDPATEAALSLTLMVRSMRSVYASRGVHGLVLSSSGLDASANEIYSTLQRYAPAGRYLH